MLVKNLFHSCSLAVVFCLGLLLFYQCNPATCNLVAPTLSTSNISTTTAKVSWGTLNTAPADDYQVELLDANTNSVISSTFTANTEYTFANLAANKAYLVRVTPRCDINTASSNQSSLNFTTLTANSSCNLAAPAKLKIVPVTSSTARVSWTDVQGATSYQINVFDSTSNTSRMFMIPPPPNLVLDSLVAGHKYSIKVAAKCPNGEVSPNFRIGDFKPFVIEDDVFMFNSKILAGNCDMNGAKDITIADGHRENFAFTSFGSMPDSGGNFYIKATKGATTVDIRLMYGNFGSKFLMTPFLNCTNYEYPDVSENVVSKPLGGGEYLEVHLFYSHIEVRIPSSATATLEKNP